MTDTHPPDTDIFAAIGGAIRNIFGSNHRNTPQINRRNVDTMMGNGFYEKLWIVRDDAPNCITPKEYELLKKFAGPNGYAIWKAWKAQTEETNDQ